MKPKLRVTFYLARPFSFPSPDSIRPDAFPP